jgi:hypothetical protein
MPHGIIDADPQLFMRAYEFEAESDPFA